MWVCLILGFSCGGSSCYLPQHSQQCGCERHPVSWGCSEAGIPTGSALWPGSGPPQRVWGQHVKVRFVTRVSGSHTLLGAESRPHPSIMSPCRQGQKDKVVLGI